MAIVPVTSTPARRRVRRPVPPQLVSPYATFERRHPEFVERYKLSRELWRNQMAALTALGRRQQHSRVRRLLRDKRFHLMFAFRALVAAKQLRRVAPDDVTELAERFDAFSSVQGERVQVREVRTGSGTRIVQDFGPVRRMHQLMVADILKSLHPPPANQKLFNGGMPMVREAIEAAYHDGQTFGMEVDIVNFYGSVTFEGLADLMRPLPANVAEHVVWDMSMRGIDVSVLSSSRMYPTPSVQPGLALGSAASSIVGEIIIAHVLAAARLTDMVTYADNIFLQGRSLVEVEAMHERLSDHFASAPVGRLGTSFTGNYDMQCGFSFAKQEAVYDEAERRFLWGPGAQKIAQYAIGEAEFRLSPAVIATAKRRVSNWRRYYPDWRDGDVHEADFLAILAARKFYAAPSPTNLDDAVHAVVIAFLASGQSRPIEEFIPDPTNHDVRRRRGDLHNEVRRWLAAAAGDAVSRTPGEVQDYVLRQAVQRFYAEASPANLSAATHAVVVAYYGYERERPIEDLIEPDRSGIRRDQLAGEVRRWLENAAR